jgi:hypothetical protein
MTYADIKAERHALLRTIHEATKRLKELDAPLLEQLAESQEAIAANWVDRKGWAQTQLRKMHLKFDPKLK